MRPKPAGPDASEADSSVHVSDDSWGVGRSASAKAEVFATEISGEELRLRVGVQSVQGARKTMEDEHQIVNDCGHPQRWRFVPRPFRPFVCPVRHSSCKHVR